MDILVYPFNWMAWKPSVSHYHKYFSVLLFLIAKKIGTFKLRISQSDFFALESKSFDFGHYRYQVLIRFLLQGKSANRCAAVEP